METVEDESVLPLEPEGQRQFDTILHTTNSLANDARLFQAANKNVTRLGMRRMLPEHISFGTLLSKLENLQVSFKSNFSVSVRMKHHFRFSLILESFGICKKQFKVLYNILLSKHV